MSSTDFSNQSPKIFLLNGPPRSGKDTGGHWLAAKYGQVVKFAEPIKRAVCAIYHGNDRAAFDHYDSAELKDMPQQVYFGKTCREAQIAVSETFLKPFHNDKGVFGKLLVQDIERREETPNLLSRRNYFVTDSGFRPEAEIIVERFGAQNVFLIRVEREGYSYLGDSRGYIALDDLGVQTLVVKNADLELYLATLDKFVRESIAV